MLSLGKLRGDIAAGTGVARRLGISGLVSPRTPASHGTARLRRAATATDGLQAHQYAFVRLI